MAARRLLIVMLILLGLSTLAAALVPRESLRDGTTETTTEPTESTEPEVVPAGKALRTTIRADRRRIQVIPLLAGDQLSLTVTSKRSDQVEIPGLGLVQAVGPAAPARFELLAREQQTYGVRLVDARRLIARIEVRERGGGAAKGPRPPARAEPGRA
ncbi:MAG: hypothetical protein ACRDL6_00380 [Solirubrobacterales bacterium]